MRSAPRLVAELEHGDVPIAEHHRPLLRQFRRQWAGDMTKGRRCDRRATARSVVVNAPPDRGNGDDPRGAEPRAAARTVESRNRSVAITGRR
jgi:hypothetical protein